MEGHQVTEDETGDSLEEEKRRSPGSCLLAVTLLSDNRGGSVMISVT